MVPDFAPLMDIRMKVHRKAPVTGVCNRWARERGICGCTPPEPFKTVLPSLGRTAEMLPAQPSARSAVCPSLFQPHGTTVRRAVRLLPDAPFPFPLRRTMYVCIFKFPEILC